jgi:hypothetical protein
MTSVRQIEANRRNSEKSTGPRTQEGKRRSRRNALRHGLCAETVVEPLEDVDDYKAFEAAIMADYDAQTAVARELVLRLASLLWRIRRATSIESDLFRIQAEILRERRTPDVIGQSEHPQNVIYRVLKAAIPPSLRAPSDADHVDCDDMGQGSEEGDDAAGDGTSDDPSRDLTHAFQRLVNLDRCVFDRLGRYEAALWRQVVQTLFALRLMRRRHHSFRNEWDRS